MRRIVIISTTFFPDPSVSAIRMTQLARHLPQFGWKPHVFCRYYGLSCSDEELHEKVHPEVTREFLGGPTTTPGISSLRLERVSGVIRHAHKFISTRRWLGSVSVPDLSLPFWRKARNHLLERVQAINPDVILTTSPPHSNHDIGRWLSRETGIPWVADFRDPYVIDNRFQPVGLGRLFARAHYEYEAAIYQTAWLVTHAIPLQARWASRKYPFALDRIRTLMNGFPEEMLEGVNGSPRNKDQRRVICVSGSILKEQQLVLAEAVAALIADGEDLELRLIGRLPSQAGRLRALLGDHFVATGFISHREATQAISQADLLVNFLNSTHRDSFLLSTKVIEYLASGRPILAINSSRSDRLFLRNKSGVTTIVANRCDELIEPLRKLIQSLPTRDPVEIEQYRCEFNWASRASRLAGWLDGIASAPPANQVPALTTEELNSARMQGKVQAKPPINVTIIQDGARLHYAIPLALQRAGILYRAFTDWFVTSKSWTELVSLVVMYIKPQTGLRMADRRSKELDAPKIVSQPLLAIYLHLARSLFNSQTKYFHWTSSKIGRWVQRYGLGDSNVLMGFLRNLDVELCAACHARGLVVVGDQIIAPAVVEMRENEQQRCRWPEWDEPSKAEDLPAIAAHENATWEAIDHITCASEYVKLGLIDVGNPPEKISVIPYPIDTENLPYIDRERRSGVLVVGFVGSVSTRKGAPYFFKTARRFDFRKVRFVMVGPVHVSKPLVEQHQGQVELIGQVNRSKIQHWLAQFDVFFFPATCEGSAGAIMEAMATGLPIVTSRNSGTVARHGQEGFIAAYDDIDKYCEYIHKLADNPELRLKMGRAARARAESFSIDWYGQEIRTLLQRLLVDKARQQALLRLPASSEGWSLPTSPIDRIRITAIITAYRDFERPQKTIRRLQLCDPLPDEIVVHVDGGDEQLVTLLCENFPGLEVRCTNQNLGPGGVRNLLIKHAQHAWVASFDDDSSPIDLDYFAKVKQVIAEFPDAAVIAAQIISRGELVPPNNDRAEYVADFVGCGCVYQKQMFLQTSGYVPLQIAYGMEEVDLAMQLRAQGKNILQHNQLRVYHDTDYKHYRKPELTMARISNMALLIFLRYPLLCWPLGMGQFIRMVLYSIESGWWMGILRGIAIVPRQLWIYRGYRRTLTVRQVLSYQWLRWHTIPVRPNDKNVEETRS